MALWAPREKVLDPVRLTNVGLEQKSLSGAETWDGLVVATGDRVLYKHAFTGAGGVFVVNAAGSWINSWAPDLPFGVPAPSGTQVFVQQGDTQARSVWAIRAASGAATFRPGVDLLAFDRVSEDIAGPWDPRARNVQGATQVFPVRPSLKEQSYYFLADQPTNLISLQDPPTDNEDTRVVVHVYTQQDATGGRAVRISPGTVAILPNPTTNFDASATAWNPFSNAQMPMVSAANTITYWRFTWTGKTRGGWLCEVFPGIAPIKALAPTTHNPGTGSVTVHIPVQVFRGSTTAYRDRVLNTLTNYFSATWRSTMAGRGVVVELAPEYPTDTDALNFVRAAPSGQPAYELFGGFASGKTLAVIGNSYTQAEVDGVVCHEISHVEDFEYFTDTAISYASRPWESIKMHGPLVQLWIDCCACEAVAPSYGINQTEWYAEMRRAHRLFGVLPTYYEAIVGSLTGSQVGQECQSVTIPHTAISGSFTLTFNGDTGSSLQWNATAAQAQAMFDVLLGPSNATVFGGPMPTTPLYVVFASVFGGSARYWDQGNFLDTNVAQMTATGSGALAGNVTVATVREGGTVDRGTKLQRFDRFRDHMNAVVPL